MKFGSEKRKNMASNEYTPGPGTYKYYNPTGNEGSAISMAKKLEYDKIEGRLKVGPGPGQYNSSTIDKANAPGYRMGTEKRKISTINADADKMPGSNMYNPKTDFTTHNNGSVSFGKEIRDPNKSSNPSRNLAPGPGTYTLGEKIKEGP